jgi:signal transduction histidine kinase
VLLVQYKEIDVDLLMKMERENPANLPMQFVAIYDSNKQPLYTSDPANLPKDLDPFILRIQENGEVRLSENENEILGFIFNHQEHEFVVIAGARDVYGLDALENLRSVIIVTFAISLIIVSIFAWIYAGRVLKPISRIVAEVDSITAASLDQRLDEGNKKDELSKLAQTFNQMLSRLEAAFLAQKNFIANASHELKTPFTVMAGEIQVTLLHPRDNAYYIKILKSVLLGINRFNKLSTQLLLLAQTSASHPQKRFNLLRFDDIMWEAKHELEKLHPEYRIEIAFDDPDINHDALLIHGDEQLLKVLLINLMDNGCKYSDDNRVQATLTTHPGKHIKVEFTNSGEGIDPEEVKRIFDPFYRARSTRNVKGFGIGLSLASKIVALHDGTLDVESIPHTVTRFVIYLPV